MKNKTAIECVTYKAVARLSMNQWNIEFYFDCYYNFFQIQNNAQETSHNISHKKLEHIVLYFKFYSYSFSLYEHWKCTLFYFDRIITCRDYKQKHSTQHIKKSHIPLVFQIYYL